MAASHLFWILSISFYVIASFYFLASCGLPQVQTISSFCFRALAPNEQNVSSLVVELALSGLVADCLYQVIFKPCAFMPFKAFRFSLLA